MTLRDSLAIALQAALTPVVAELGALCTVYRATVTRAADGSVKRSYLPDVDWSSIPAVFSLGTSEDGTGGSESVAKPFGVRSSGKASLTFLRRDIGLPQLTAFDGFIIHDGPYAGFSWMAESDGVMDPVGASVTVRLIAAPARAFA